MRNQTNQKLSRVKILLVALQDATADTRLVAALAEAVLLELGLAYRCFLSEIATAQGLTAQAPLSATALAEALAKQQLHIAEVDQLVNLEMQQQWPHSLLTIAHASVQTTPNVQTTPKQAATAFQDGLINVIQVDDIVENKLSYSYCYEVYQALRICIQQQRDMAQEW